MLLYRRVDTAHMVRYSLSPCSTLVQYILMYSGSAVSGLDLIQVPCGQCFCFVREEMTQRCIQSILMKNVECKYLI